MRENTAYDVGGNIRFSNLRSELSVRSATGVMQVVLVSHYRSV